MAEINFDYHPQFFTATLLEWKHLLKADEYKDIIINSLRRPRLLPAGGTPKL
jgi:putative transposase